MSNILIALESILRTTTRCLGDGPWVARNLLGPLLLTFSVHLVRELMLPMAATHSSLIPEALALFVVVFLLLCLVVVRTMGSMRHLRHWFLAVPIDLGGHLTAHWIAHAVLLR